ncbi:hypothetical protein [Streptomyces albipurpureus]|uniref:Uncharacterized protein n=1 Tax=Streptomyces albipurpureus TaxID=2897419 RepID=A0ABT0V3F9_9ACTN|nr:hypothetical protein [Streptomyces sp. CWNU-1]MCM2394088.1 hypothetical protein [Streptomyces sp. CWNU-1]
MQLNLADLANAALSARSVPYVEGGATAPARVRLDDTTAAMAADICVRGDLGFVLLLHRRKDGLVAEEIYSSTREADGSWAPADHLSGGVTMIEPTDPHDVGRALRGQALTLFGESETNVFTGRVQAVDGHELVRIHEFLVDARVDCLDIEDHSPGADPNASKMRKPLTSQAAVVVLFPGERFTVGAVAMDGAEPHTLGEPVELTGPDDRAAAGPGF